MTTSQRARTPKARDQKPLYTIGIVADTHIPDRVSALHPLIFPALRTAKVTHIFHAGDICSSSVLAQLQEIAPVSAVRGNRDWFVRDVPMIFEIEIGGIPIALMHGHGGILSYLIEKALFLFRQYDVRRYQKSLFDVAPSARIVIFGHTHRPEAVWSNEKLLFNPGSASFGVKKYFVPTIGFLRIYEDGRVKPTFHYLKGYQIKKRRWVPITTDKNR